MVLGFDAPIGLVFGALGMGVAGGVCLLATVPAESPPPVVVQVETMGSASNEYACEETLTLNTLEFIDCGLGNKVKGWQCRDKNTTGATVTRGHPDRAGSVGSPIDLDTYKDAQTHTYLRSTTTITLECTVVY